MSTTPDTRIAPHKIHKRLRRRSGDLMIAEVDGDLWWTDRYVAVRMAGNSDPVRLLLAQFNLTAQPMRCIVERTVQRVSGDSPNIAGLVAQVMGASPTPVAPVKAEGASILLFGAIANGSKVMECWRGDAGLLFIDPKNRRLIERLTPGGDWLCPPAPSRPLKPWVRVLDGSPVALAMPVQGPDLAAETLDGLLAEVSA